MPRICVRRCILALFVGKLKYGDSRLSILLVKENAPTPDSLGATNGLVLFAMCVTRSFCPAFVRYGATKDNRSTEDRYLTHEFL